MAIMRMQTHVKAKRFWFKQSPSAAGYLDTGVNLQVGAMIHLYSYLRSCSKIRLNPPVLHVLDESLLKDLSVSLQNHQLDMSERLYSREVRDSKCCDNGDLNTVYRVYFLSPSRPL